MDIITQLKGLLYLLSYHEWFAINVLLSGFLLIGIYYTYRSLREMSRSQRLSSAQQLFEELKSTEEARLVITKKILTTIDENPKKELKDFDVSKFNDNDKEKIRSIINSINRLGLLMENDILSQKFVFSICYPVLIQSWAMSEAYANEYQKLLAVPYARRVERTAKRAKNYFNSIYPNKEEKINLVFDQRTVEIYKTINNSGLKGFFQKIKFKKMKLTDNYSEELFEQPNQQQSIEG